MGIYSIKQKLFQYNTAVVHISLLKPIGTIKKVLHNFQKLFQQEPKEFIGQNLNILLPKAFSQVHNRILEKFVQNGNLTNIQKGELLFCGADKGQFIFPLEVRLKLDTYSGNDFGVSASLSSQLSLTQYILFDSVSLSIKNFC
ncbi:hypothetical protein ABPG72_015136 [Tetrahymena utriculariae]